MREDFLHFVWRTKRFAFNDIRSTQGETIHIEQWGQHNHQKGPDFLHARIQIGDTTWAGQVEMHLKSSDWHAHKHNQDSEYQNVILHVVLEEDAPIINAKGQRIPCLELRPYIAPDLVALYQKIEQNTHWVPCQAFFPNVSAMTRNFWLERMMVERLEQKSQLITAVYEDTQQHWEATFFRFLARNFGFHHNGDAFEALAAATPMMVLAKNRDNLMVLNAILLGQAGFLEGTFEDGYPIALQREYLYQAHKYQLKPIDKSAWHFMGLRPHNFPTIRLVQFAQLMHTSVHLFREVMHAKEWKTLLPLFKVEADGYWKNHYVFDKPSVPSSKKLSASSIQLLIINTLVPFVFYYGHQTGQSDFCDRALHWMEQLPAEKNAILEKWTALGAKPENALQSQGLLQLKKQHCDQKKCLSCGIGQAVLV